MARNIVPAITPESSLTRYLQQIRKFPMLTVDEEYMLSRRWLDHDDVDAAGQMVNSHLRLVAKIAMKYRGYGLPVADLVSEGNIGLMKAVKKFDPGLGFRLSTYAMWWIRASIQEYVLRSWSLVKIGTTSAQKKLFFNLRKIKSRLQAFDEGDLAPETVTEIANRLHVPEVDVVAMNRRLSAQDLSLNVTVGGGDGGVEKTPQHQGGIAGGHRLKILPGFMMFWGSSAIFNARMTLTASPCSAVRKSILP